MIYENSFNDIYIFINLCFWEKYLFFFGELLKFSGKI